MAAVGRLSEGGFMEKESPMWAKPSRLACLARLLQAYIGKGGWQVDLLTGEVYHPEYEARIQALIQDWAIDDRAEREAAWQAERKAMHALNERGRVRGQFNATGKDAFYAVQPTFYLDGLGISGLTFKPFAKVRVSSSFVNLHVDLGHTLRRLSKNGRRKAIRYGKALPQELQAEVDELCRQAVRHYQAH